MKIGIFDSGLGGLSVFRQFLKYLPQYDYIYLGDNKRAPYGSYSKETIYEYTKQAVNYLFKQDCALVVLACNTATAGALHDLQQKYLPSTYPDRRILGVIRPGIEATIENSAKRIGIIATEATVKSKSFIYELFKFTPAIKIFQKATPLLVPKIEAGELASLELEELIVSYLKPLLKHNIDTLLLGCTHYELIAPIIAKHVGPKVHIVAEGKVTALKLKEYLKRHTKIESILQKNHSVQLCVTHKSLRYEKLVDIFLEDYISPIPALDEVIL
jgi:glutamate racemase